jgi:hypothetical protein
MERCEIMFSNSRFVASEQVAKKPEMTMKFLNSIWKSVEEFSTMSLKYNQQNAKFSYSIYFYKLLYMFQAVPPPIIRSTKLYIQRQVLSNQYCCYRGRDGR